jgi:chaperonin GroEL (HSP60 family)
VSCFSADSARFHEDLLNIARTTLSSKILSQHKEHFSKLAVDAVLRLKGSGNLSAIQIIKKTGGTLEDSFLDEGINKKSSVFPILFLIGSIFLFTVAIIILGGHPCIGQRQTNTEHL